MSDRPSRIAALSGVAYLGLLVATTALIPTKPKLDASGRHVIAFFDQHHTAVHAGDLLSVAAVAALACFAGALLVRVRQSGAGLAPATVALVGAALMGAGLTVGASVSLALSAGHLTPDAAQALNAISYDMFLPIAAGMIVFGVGMGTAVLRGGWMPAWAGWVLVAFGVIAATPVFPLSLFGIALWSAVAGVRLATRGGVEPRSVPVPA